MNITREQRDRFINMLQDFAARYDLHFDYEYTPGFEKLYVKFECRSYQPLHYTVVWSEVHSLTEAGTAIFADVVCQWIKKYDKCDIKEVIFNPPATIVFWNDGTKTVVKCQNDEVFDAEKGLAMAISKKYFGNKGSYCNQIKKWTEKYEEEQNWLKDVVKGLRELGRRLKEESDRGRIHRAYNALVAALHKKRPRKDEMAAAMEEAIGYLGEVLDD